jgi:hypothetical protein
LVAELVGGLGIGKETSKQMTQASGFGAAVGGMSDDLRKTPGGARPGTQQVIEQRVTVMRPDAVAAGIRADPFDQDVQVQ